MPFSSTSQTINIDLKSINLDVRDRLFVFLQEKSGTSRDREAHVGPAAAPPVPGGDPPSSVAAALPALAAKLVEFWHLLPQVHHNYPSIFHHIYFIMNTIIAYSVYFYKNYCVLSFFCIFCF